MSAALFVSAWQGPTPIARAALDGVHSSAHVADGDDRDWVGTPSFVSGTSLVSRGEFIYSDYVHDDSGANVDGLSSPNPDIPNPVTGIYPNPQDPLSPRIGGTGNQFIDRFRHTGDYAYPSSGPSGLPLAYPGGYSDVADLLELRIARDAAGLHFLVRLGAMTAPDSSVVAICLDADRNAGTGAQAWPHDANLNDPLGCDYFLTLWGTGGEWLDYTGTTPRPSPVRVAVNPDARPPFMEADVALSEALLRGVWRVYAGTGCWDAAGRRFKLAVDPNQLLAPGNVTATFPNLYDLAFQPTEANDYWHDTHQANSLAVQDISAFHADVDLDRLAQGASDAPPRLTGLLNIQYSALPLDDGQGATTNYSGGPGTFVYKGPVQPYSLMVPSDYYSDPRPRPLVLFFHPSNVNHNIWPVGIESAATPHLVFTPMLGTDAAQAVVDRNGFLVAGTLQRGEKGPAGPNLPWGDIPGVGERDLLDVLDTVIGRDGYAVDPDRLFFAGMSYGGQTTQTMMTLYPDRIAAAVAYNAPGTGIPARLLNLRNVYYVHVTGDTGLDATAAIYGRQASQQVVQMGYPHLYLEYLGRAHDFNLVYESLPIIEQTAYRAVRDPNPARVSYRMDRAIEEPDAELGLAHDHAYWVSGLKLADGASSGSVDATALPLTYKLPKRISRLTGTFLNRVTGNKLYVIWQEWDRHLTGHGLQDFQAGWVPGPDVTIENWTPPVPDGAGSNGFTLEAVDLSAVTLELSRMRITLDRGPATGRIATNQLLQLTLELPTGAGMVRVRLDGQPLRVQVQNGVLIVPIPAGQHVIVLEP